MWTACLKAEGTLVFAFLPRFMRKMCVALCPGQECVCHSANLCRPPKPGVTVRFQEALARTPRGARPEKPLSLGQ